LSNGVKLMLRRDHILYLIATLLISVHVIDVTILFNVSPWFMSLFAVPYIVVSVLWTWLKDTAKLSITIIFLILELNRLATSTIPELVTSGVNRATFHNVLYLLGVILLVWVLWTLAIRVFKEKTPQ